MTGTASPDRSRYAPSLREFLDGLDRAGLSEVVRRGRTDSPDHVLALSRQGVVSSSRIRLGEGIWRLTFTKVGRALRKLLLAEAARR